ncbi:MAG TPA: PHB depolymerase family esterase, partial [Polyangiaceae bacterium]|nr:PHB depolymerase family esterase [Polyangiaceae bacterium]
MRAATLPIALFLAGCGTSNAVDAGWEGTPSDASFEGGTVDLADAYPTADPNPDASAPSPDFDASTGTSVTCAGKTLGAGSHDENVTSGGLARVGHMHVPSSYDKTKGTMLVVAYHGFSESGLEQEVQSRMDTSSDAKGYIVAYPDGIATSWNAGDCCGDSWTGGVDDVQFTRDLLGAIEADYCIDPKRVFATGFSNGGFLSHKLGCEMSDVFGAIAPVSGVLGEDPSLCKPKRPIPVLDFHGSSDPVVPYDGGTPFINIGMGIVFRSVPDTLAFWVNENGCLAPPVTIFQNGDAT